MEFAVPFVAVLLGGWLAFWQGGQTLSQERALRALQEEADGLEEPAHFWAQLLRDYRREAPGVHNALRSELIGEVEFAAARARTARQTAPRLALAGAGAMTLLALIPVLSGASPGPALATAVLGLLCYQRVRALVRRAERAALKSKDLLRKELG